MALGCGYISPYMGECKEQKTVNQQVLDGIRSRPKHLRKFIRRLAKQYEIIDVIQEPVSHAMIHVTTIRYKNFFDNTNTRIFEFSYHVPYEISGLELLRSPKLRW